MLGKIVIKTFLKKIGAGKQCLGLEDISSNAVKYFVVFAKYFVVFAQYFVHLAAVGRRSLATLSTLSSGDLRPSSAKGLWDLP